MIRSAGSGVGPGPVGRETRKLVTKLLLRWGVEKQTLSRKDEQDLVTRPCEHKRVGFKNCAWVLTCRRFWPGGGAGLGGANRARGVGRWAGAEVRGDTAGDVQEALGPFLRCVVSCSKGASWPLVSQ